MVQRKETVYIPTCFKHKHMFRLKENSVTHSGPGRTWIYGLGDSQRYFLNSYLKKNFIHLDDFLYSPMVCIPQNLPKWTHSQKKTPCNWLLKFLKSQSNLWINLENTGPLQEINPEFNSEWCYILCPYDSKQLLDF